MKRMYRVNDIFYSLQGEGRNSGMAAVFIRFSGCNLKCSFCDTDFSEYKEMTLDDILNSVKQLTQECTGNEHPLIVLTGGEPTLQVDEEFISAFHDLGYKVAMESNGTKEPPANLDWFTVSPKTNVKVKKCNELKCIFDERMLTDTFDIEADYYYLQPCDTGNLMRNSEIMTICIEYIKLHPKWRLSLQTHKLIGFK